MELVSFHYIGLFILAHCILSVWAIIRIARSSMESVCKTLWMPIVVCFPGVGVGAFLIFGRRD